MGLWIPGSRFESGTGSQKEGMMYDPEFGDHNSLFAGIVLVVVGLGGYALVWYVLLSSPMASSL